MWAYTCLSGNRQRFCYVAVFKTETHQGLNAKAHSQLNRETSTESAIFPSTELSYLASSFDPSHKSTL